MSGTNHWTFFSNHGHVMIYLSSKSDMPLREVATAVGITERAVQRIVADLEDAGYLLREKRGRQNVYTINREMKLRHDLERKHSIGEILDVLGED